MFFCTSTSAVPDHDSDNNKQSLMSEKKVIPFGPCGESLLKEIRGQGKDNSMYRQPHSIQMWWKKERFGMSLAYLKTRLMVSG